METVFAGFNISFSCIIFADFVLKTPAFQIFVETFVTFHSIERFDVSFKNSAIFPEGGGVSVSAKFFPNII